MWPILLLQYGLAGSDNMQTRLSWCRRSVVVGIAGSDVVGALVSLDGGGRLVVSQFSHLMKFSTLMTRSAEHDFVHIRPGQPRMECLHGAPHVSPHTLVGPPLARRCLCPQPLRAIRLFPPWTPGCEICMRNWRHSTSVCRCVRGERERG